MTNASDVGILVEQRDGIAIWTLARPDRMNSLTTEMLRAFEQLVHETRASKEVRAVVITGQGTRAFCAGADLKERRSMSDAQVREFLNAAERTLLAIDRLDRPVIAALNGAALGGGLELALACDLRVAAPGVALGLPEVSIGIIPGAGGTQRLPRVVGLSRATQMVLLSERVSAEEAWQIGLVHRVAPADQDVLAFALELARPFREGAPLALAAALEALRAADELPLEAGLNRERACYERVLTSEDRKEALEAFAAKRKPEFKGR
ncbi:MAG: enoyl-CoA hydratase-related protein [Myxococcales bacterium]